MENRQAGYGIIEGFYGRPWSWQARREYGRFMQQHGYRFYLYAPKADRCLREEWRAEWPDEHYQQLAALADHYHQCGLRWGIGFSPYEIYKNFDSDAAQALEKKIRYFNTLDPDILAVLFDDMKGDCLEIAQLQAEIISRIISASTARTFIMCPTYYSDAKILDKLFGERPPDYLTTLGKILPPEVDIFWTGPEVCSKSYPSDHLQKVIEQLGRRPFIWDNYPVNDGERMCKFLHLRAFENRTAEMAALTSGHAINPMNQAYLSMIPLQTLALSYRSGDGYQPAQAFLAAANELCGEQFAQMLADDLALFQDVGLDKLTDDQKQEITARYRAYQSEFSNEIVSWLAGEYAYSPECLTDT